MLTEPDLSDFIFDSSKLKSTPKELIKIIVDYVFKNGHETNFENIALGFPKINEINSKSLVCAAVVKFVGEKQGVQYIVFRKIKRNNKDWDDWKVFKRSEIMPPNQMKKTDIFWF